MLKIVATQNTIVKSVVASMSIDRCVHWRRSPPPMECSANDSIDGGTVAEISYFGATSVCAVSAGDSIRLCWDANQSYSAAWKRSPLQRWTNDLPRPVRRHRQWRMWCQAHHCSHGWDTTANHRDGPRFSVCASRVSTLSHIGIRWGCCLTSPAVVWVLNTRQGFRARRSRHFYFFGLRFNDEWSGRDGWDRTIEKYWRVLMVDWFSTRIFTWFLDLIMWKDKENF